ncbi:MAG: DUF418 domain-containing protein [Ferruginibacter sp.]
MNKITTPTESVSFVAPTAQAERLTILDSLRGIAILAILLMNIPGFGLPHIATSDPGIIGETGKNYYIWYIIDWVFDSTQRGIFSILFGAGIILFITRLEKRLSGIQPAEYFFRRQLWLLLFGLINVFVLLFSGEILYAYAICGMLLFAFIRLSPKKLFIAAFICFLLSIARENKNLYHDKSIINDGETVALLDTTTLKLNSAQYESLKKMQAFKNENSHEEKKKEFDKQVTMTRGGFWDIYKIQSEEGVASQTIGFYSFFWELVFLMLLGMGFYKTGIITATRSFKTYLLLFIIGFGIGLPLSYLQLQPEIHFGFNRYEITKNAFFGFKQISRFFRTIGFLGLIMLLYKSGRFTRLFNLMRPVGQMAFTNYLMQIIICGIIFYGIGFSMFARLQRYELYYVMAGVWVFQIIFSHFWLKYFRYGPFEWLWRSLTYWKLQPIKKEG